MASDDRQLDRRGFLTAAGGAAATVALAGCAGDNPSPSPGDQVGTGDGQTDAGGNGGPGGAGNILTYARGGGSTSLDPQNTTSGEDAKVTNQLYNKLIEFEPGKTSLTQGLATDWTVDGTTVALTLREGVKFTNGDTFTASDFVATFRRFTDPEYEYYPGGTYASAYGPYALGNWIETVEATSDTELTIKLYDAYAPILANLAMFCSAVLSETAIKELGTKLKSQPVGTAAFKFENWDKSNQRIRLVKNPDFWGEPAKVDEVLFTTISSNTTRAQTLVSGDAQIVDGLGAQSASIVKNDGSAELLSAPGINIGYLAMNMAQVEAFRDKRVRQAMNYAINTKAIVENIYKGIAQQASQPIPKSVLGYNEKLDPYPYDPEKATSLLQEAGYGDGLSFTLSTFKNPRPYNPSPTQAAQVVRSNLQQVGVTVTIDQQPWEQFLSYTSAGKHDACFLGWMTDNGDPDNFYYALLDPGVAMDAVPEGQDWVSFDTEGFNTLNVSAWANTEYMTLVRDAQKIYDPEKRKPMYEKAGKMSHEEAPWVFIDHAKILRGVSKGVSNYKLELIGGPFLRLVELS